MITKTTTANVLRATVIVPSTNQGCSDTSVLLDQPSAIPERFRTTSEPGLPIVRKELSSISVPVPFAGVKQ